MSLFQELSWREVLTDCESILYLVRPSPRLMKQIAKQVAYFVSQRVRTPPPPTHTYTRPAHRGALSPRHSVRRTRCMWVHAHPVQQAKDISVYFVPRRTVKCEKILQDEEIGTFGRVYDHCTIGGAPGLL